MLHEEERGSFNRNIVFWSRTQGNLHAEVQLDNVNQQVLQSDVGLVKPKLVHEVEHADGNRGFLKSN